MCEDVTSLKVSQGFVEFNITFVLDLRLSSFNGEFGKRQPYNRSQLKSQLENNSSYYLHNSLISDGIRNS